MGNSSFHNTIYEYFIRSAFSISKENLIERREDPGSLAHTDVFGKYDIEFVKAAVGYAMAIFNSHIGKNFTVSEVDENTMKAYLKDVINAPDKRAIYDLIMQYEEIREKYYKSPWPKISNT